MGAPRWRANECDRRQTHSVVAVAKMIMRNVIVAAAPAIELTTSRETRAAQVRVQRHRVAIRCRRVSRRARARAARGRRRHALASIQTRPAPVVRSGGGGDGSHTLSNLPDGRPHHLTSPTRNPPIASTAAARRLVQIFKVTRLTRVLCVVLPQRAHQNERHDPREEDDHHEGIEYLRGPSSGGFAGARAREDARPSQVRAAPRPKTSGSGARRSRSRGTGRSGDGRKSSSASTPPNT